MQFAVVGVDEGEREENLGESKEDVGCWTASTATDQLSDHYNNTETGSKIQNLEE